MKVKLALLFFLTAASVPAQSPSKQELPKIPEPEYISLVFTKKPGAGKISAADRNGKVQQWLEVWENDVKSPNVITYVLVADGKSFSATWR